MNLKIKDLIYRVDGLMPRNECIYFINLFEKYSNIAINESSTKYLIGKNPYVKYDNYKALSLTDNSDNPELQSACELAWSYVSLMIEKYVFYLKLNISEVINKDFINSTTSLRILKYNVNEYIEDHLDVSPNIRGSCTINLNENYEGGEFSFFSGKHFELLKTGDGIIFPAEPIWIHGTKKITFGTRYSISCFLQSNLP